MILVKNLVNVLLVGLFIIGPIVQTVQAQYGGYPNMFNYNYPQYPNVKPGSYGQPCYGGCQRGLVCSRTRMCDCPTDYIYSDQLKGCVDCPSPWTLVNGICVQYFNNGTALTWNEARTKCQTLGADLLDIKFDVFFQTADLLLGSVLNNINSPVFYVGVQTPNPSFFSYESVIYGNQIPPYSNLWRCNFLNNQICTCSDIYTDQVLCQTIGIALNFNDTFPCKRCVYASFADASTIPSNGSLQLYPVDCSTVEIPVQSYICQKDIQFPQVTYNNEIYTPTNPTQKTGYVDYKCNTQPTYTTNTKCYSDRECTNNLTCINYYCSCPYGHHLINNTECRRCPAGWIYYDGYCNLVSTEKRNFLQALNSCTNNGSTLINIDSYPSYPSTLFGLLNCIGTDESFWVNAVNCGGWLRFNNLIDHTLESFDLNRPWYERYEFTSCEIGDEVGYYDNNHNGYNVMVANAARNSLSAESQTDEYRYICQFRLDRPNNINYLNIREGVVEFVQCPP